MKKAAKLEKDLYPSLEQWLRKHKACSQTWRVGQKPVIRLEVPGPNRRTPDVAGALLAQGTWRTHIIEAKQPKSGTALQTAVAQLESVRQWGDYLWVAMHADDWSQHGTKGQQDLTSELKKRRLGLAVVEDGAVAEIISAELNTTTRDLCREQLLEALNVSRVKPRFLQQTLSNIAVRAAAEALDATSDFLSEVEEVWLERKLPRPKGDISSLTVEYQSPQYWIVFHTPLWTEELGIEGDPFGCYRNDGQPTIWVWVPLKENPLKACQQLREIVPGWYFYGENETGDDWFHQHLDDVNPDDQRAAAFKDTCLATLSRLTVERSTDFGVSLLGFSKWQAARRLQRPSRLAAGSCGSSV